MTEPERAAESTGGWTILKVLGFIIGLAGMVGFGMCGLFGLAAGIGFGAGRSEPFIVTLGLLGLGIAALFIWLMRAMVRSANRRPPGSSGP